MMVLLIVGLAMWLLIALLRWIGLMNSWALNAQNAEEYHKAYLNYREERLSRAEYAQAALKARRASKFVLLWPIQLVVFTIKEIRDGNTRRKERLVKMDSYAQEGIR